MGKEKFVLIKQFEESSNKGASSLETASEVKPSKDFLEKIGRTSLYLLIFLLPLFFLPLTIAPVEINKQVLAIILISIAFLCYLIRSLRSRVVVYPKSLLSLAVLILLLVAAGSTIFSQARSISIFGNFIQPDALLGFLIYGLAFFLAAVFFKKEDFPKIGFCFFVSLILTMVFGWLQIFGKFILPWVFTRQTSFSSVGSVSSWGVFITFGLVMIVAVLLTNKINKINRIIMSLVGLLILATLVVLNYQLLWLGLALAMFLLVVYKFTVRSEFILPLTLIAISLFFVLVGRQLPTFIRVPLEVRPSLATTLTVTKGVLIDSIGEVGPISLIRRIGFGSGPATFGYNFSRFRPAELNQTSFWQVRFNQGFNFLATLLSNLGLLGILAVLFFIFSFVREGLRTWKNEISLIVFSGVFFLVINLFFYPASFVQLFFIFLSLGLLALDSGRSFEIEFYSPSKLQNFWSFIVFSGITLLLSFSLFLLYLPGQKYVAAVYYEKALRSSSPAQSLSRIEKAIRLDSQSDQYLRALSQVRLLQANELIKTPPSQEKPQDIQSQLQNIIALAINAGRRAAELNPADSLNWSNLANVYENIMTFVGGADIFAQQNYQKAMELDPKNPQLPVDLARTFLLGQKLNEAKSALEKAFRLKSDYAPAHFLMAQIYISEGNLTGAIERVEEIKRTNLWDAGLAFQLGILYYRNDQINLAQNEFERAVALDENYSNARYFLGLIYDQKNQKQKAIEQFEKIEQFNPDNQEVKKILVNLREGRAALDGIAPPAQLPAERLETPVKELEKEEIKKP